MSRHGPLLLLVLVACAPACALKRAITAEDDDLLPVREVSEPIIVAAWAEPKTLPPAGGQTQLLVRVQMRGGAAYPGVEVRFRTSAGALYSRGAILVTDASGRTRDRLTTSETAVVTLNAGGTRYRFRVPVGGEAAP